MHGVSAGDAGGAGCARSRRSSRRCLAGLRAGRLGVTAWPPNWLRSAATTFIAGESSCREAKRAKSAAVITGIGTAWSIAACTVHRPSPESSAQPRELLELGVAVQRGIEQVEQPGPDDRALAPDC